MSYRTINPQFWDDAKVVDEFTPEDRYFYLYLLTNPHVSICGCYEISIKKMSMETGYEVAKVKKLLTRFEETLDVIKYDYQTKEVLIWNWHKYNWTSSDKMISGIRTALRYISSGTLRDIVSGMVDCLENNTPYDRVSIPYAEGIDTSVSESVSVSVSESVSVSVNNTDKDIENLCIDNNISEYLEDSIKEWVAYKKQQHRFTYQSKSLASLVKKIAENARQYGDGAVIKVIQDSMSNGYKGILWDKIRGKPNTQRSQFEDLMEQIRRDEYDG